MVLKGQYLERPTIIRSGELFLEGLYHRGDRSPAALILAPLAAGGSPMEIPIVAELAWALHRSRRPTLRFNPRGFGASQGSPAEGTGLLEDQEAALSSLRESVPGLKVAVIAVGSAGRSALELVRADGACGALVLLAPPADVWPALEASVGVPALVALPEGAARPEGQWAKGAISVREVANTDAQFLQGLSLFGRAVTQFLDGLG